MNWYTHTHTHTHTGIFTQSWKQWNVVICSNMDGPREYYTKWRQRKINIIGYHLYVESKNNTTESIYIIETHSHI